MTRAYIKWYDTVAVLSWFDTEWDYGIDWWYDRNRYMMMHFDGIEVEKDFPGVHAPWVFI